MVKNKKRITLRDIWERMNNMEERMDEMAMHMRKLSIEVQAVKQQNSSPFVEPFAKPKYKGTSASGPEIVWE